MKDYPKKICEELTLTCMRVEASFSASDITPVVLNERKFTMWGYEYPQWLNTMIQWKLDKPVFSTEESFRKYFERVLNIEVLRDIYHAIFNIFDEVREEAYHQVLYAIAAEILIYNPESSLWFEWHCKSNDFEHVNGPNNLALFKNILIRESAFWQPNLRVKALAMSGGAAVTP